MKMIRLVTTQNFCTFRCQEIPMQFMTNKYTPNRATAWSEFWLGDVIDLYNFEDDAEYTVNAITEFLWSQMDVTDLNDIWF